MQSIVKKNDGDYIKKTLDAIADGYDWELIFVEDVEDSSNKDIYLIKVENPNFKEDNGENPFMCFYAPANQEIG